MSAYLPMHHIGAPMHHDSAPMHQIGAAGVLFLYHTTGIGFQGLRPGEAPTTSKVYVLSYNMYIFLHFLYILRYLYSIKTHLYSSNPRYEKCILSRKNACKFLFFKER